MLPLFIATTTTKQKSKSLDLFSSSSTGSHRHNHHATEAPSPLVATDIKKITQPTTSPPSAPPLLTSAKPASFHCSDHRQPKPCQPPCTAAFTTLLLPPPHYFYHLTAIIATSPNPAQSKLQAPDYLSWSWHNTRHRRICRLFHQRLLLPGQTPKRTPQLIVGSSHAWIVEWGRLSWGEDIKKGISIERKV